MPPLAFRAACRRIAPDTAAIGRSSPAHGSTAARRRRSSWSATGGRSSPRCSPARSSTPSSRWPAAGSPPSFVGSPARARPEVVPPRPGVGLAPRRARARGLRARAGAVWMRLVASETAQGPGAGCARSVSAGLSASRSRGPRSTCFVPSHRGESPLLRRSLRLAIVVLGHSEEAELIGAERHPRRQRARFVCFPAPMLRHGLPPRSRSYAGFSSVVLSPL